MRLHNVSIENLRRRKAKMIFLILGLVVGVATVVALVTIASTMQADIDKKLDEYGANILIVPKSDQLSLSYGGMTISGAYDVEELQETDVPKIMEIKNSENISVIAPKVLGAIKADNKQALLVGVDFEKELRIKKWWNVDGSEPENSEEVLLGSEAATKLNKKPGDEIRIKDRNFTVAGILDETGSQEDQVVFADLKTSQTLLNQEGKLSLIEISALCSTCPIEQIVSQISKELPSARVSAVKQAVQSKMNILSQFTSFAVGISIVVIFIGVLIVFITMMSSVNERTREIGIFRSFGFRRFHIMRIILFEALLTSVVGGIIGYSLGIGAAWLILAQMTELAVSFTWNPLLAVLAIVLAVVISEVASFYPAVRASNLDPAQALRSI